MYSAVTYSPGQCTVRSPTVPVSGVQLQYPSFFRESPSISMALGGGPRPSGAPRIPARAPRATRAYIWRAFPPETSGPATRPRRGLAPRRPGGWERLFLCERQRFAPSNRPGLLARPMRVQNYLGALAPCAVRERQVAWPVSRRRAARPTEPPIARNCGALQHLPSCVSDHQRPPALQGAPSLPI